MYGAYTGTYKKEGKDVNLLINRVYSENTYIDISEKLKFEQTENKTLKMDLSSCSIAALSNITEFEKIDDSSELPLAKAIDTYVDSVKMAIIGKYKSKRVRVLGYAGSMEEYKVELELYINNTYKMVLEPSPDDDSYIKDSGNFVIENSKYITLYISKNVKLKLELQNNRNLKNISCDVAALSIIEQFERLDDNYGMSIINKI